METTSEQTGEHVVFFPSYDGSPAFRRLPSLEEAVRFVEHLRNNEGVEQFSVHALTPVPLAVKPYFRVEVPQAAQPAPTPAVAEPGEQAGGQDLPAVPGLVPAQERQPEPEPETGPVPAPVSEAPEAPSAPTLSFFAR
jgi:hypothetical protein